MTDQAASKAPASSEVGALLCSKCKKNPRAQRGSWCQQCRRGAQRDYNNRTRSRPEVKTAPCEVCGKLMTWTSGRGPDRRYCSRECKIKTDTAVQAVRRQADPATVERTVVQRERDLLYRQGMRRCNLCGDVKALDDFYRRGSGWQHRCIPCSIEHGRQEVAEVRRRSWRSHIKIRFGLSVEAWEARLIAQAGLCAICQVQMREPHVDHDHACCPDFKTCGRCVRGLLCESCNYGIGKLRDDPELLRRAAEYLDAHEMTRESAH